MGTSKKRSVSPETVCENLADYAVDREDLKILIQALPTGQEINTVTLDYEMQLLKIISVGWSISVYMADHPMKDGVVENFWSRIRDFSHNLSNVTSLTIGQDIDYFQMIKDRFDVYVSSLNGANQNEDPVSFIAPTFAGMCKNEENPFVSLTGARVFNMCVAGVKEYFDAIVIEAEH